MFVFSDRAGVKNQPTISALQEMFLNSLQQGILSSHPTDTGLLAKLLMMISPLRDLGLEYRKLIATLRNNSSNGSGSGDNVVVDTAARPEQSFGLL